MSGPPPDNLKQWSKNALIREVERLRALTREMSTLMGDDPREAAGTGAIIDAADDPYAVGGVLLDARRAVLMDTIDVSLVDTKAETRALAMLLAIGGRVNYALDRVEHAYLFGPDGAAGLVSELIGLATRAGVADAEHGRLFAREFTEALNKRMEELP